MEKAHKSAMRQWKRREEGLKEIDEAINSLKSDYLKNLDVLETMEGHKNFLEGLAPRPPGYAKSYEEKKAKLKEDWLKEHKHNRDDPDDYLIFPNAMKEKPEVQAEFFKKAR